MKRLLCFVVLLGVASPALAGEFTSEVLVLNSAVTLVTTTRSPRQGVEIQNNGPNAIYCAVVSTSANSADAVLTKSRKVSAGEAWGLSLPAGRAVYCRAATADQVTGAATVVTEVD